MDIVKNIHEKYLGRKTSANYKKILAKIIENEKKLRATMTDDQQLLLSHLLHDYQSLQLLDQTELIKFSLSLLKQLYF